MLTGAAAAVMVAVAVGAVTTACTSSREAWDLSTLEASAAGLSSKIGSTAGRAGLAVGGGRWRSVVSEAAAGPKAGHPAAADATDALASENPAAAVRRGPAAAKSAAEESAPGVPGGR